MTFDVLTTGPEYDYCCNFKPTKSLLTVLYTAVLNQQKNSFVVHLYLAINIQAN